MAVMKTPGVYIVEKNAFPNSVVEVATAVPAFVGYTEKALHDNKSLIEKAKRITSMAEFRLYFGGAPKAKFEIKEGTEGIKFADGKHYSIVRTDPYNLYYNMMLFYANGGGPCYVVSVDTYKTDPTEQKIDRASLEKGINILLKEPEPTMLVIPEAVSLAKADDCYGLQQAMLKHCGYDMRNRIALLDIYKGYEDSSLIDDFRSFIGSDFMDYGAAYYPWINFSIVQENEIDYSNTDWKILSEYLKNEITEKYSQLEKSKQAKVTGNTEDEKNAKFAEIQKAIEELKKKETDLIDLITTEENNITTEVTAGKKEEDFDAVRKKNHNILFSSQPLYKDIMKEMRLGMNQLPVSAAMAGVITRVDNSRGVWKAPANVGVITAVNPTQTISSEEQEDLNMPLSGKAVNAIRAFAGEGLKVWGARTLDGNSLDWKYINVRRTMIMLEESVKNAARAYVFDPNDANTWVNIKSMISNFLNGIWKRGGLAGSSPEDAFSVNVGLGETMTPEDILEGIMRITVLVAIVRPAEFIEITFQQQMQKS